jgi:hypothetical protein
MFLYHGFHLLPVVRTPPARWLEIPIASSVPVVDDAGVAFAQDLQLTEGFWVVVGVYLAWTALLRWLASR